MMPIALATHADLDRIMQIVAACVSQFQQRGSDQWNEHYPTRDVFTQDLGSLYVLRENDLIIGAIVLNEVKPAEYNEITWSYNEATPMVVHRLCVDPSHQGRGAASRLMDFAEDHARKHRYTSIRLDTHTGNPKAIALYERRGYEVRGRVTLKPRNLPVVCFELLLKE